jgi:hypothetical protein
MKPAHVDLQDAEQMAGLSPVSTSQLGKAEFGTRALLIGLSRDSHLLYVLDGEPVGRKGLDLFSASGYGCPVRSSRRRVSGAIASNVPPDATSRPTLTIVWRRGGSRSACTVMTSTTRPKARRHSGWRMQVGRHVVHR